MNTVHGEAFSGKKIRRGNTERYQRELGCFNIRLRFLRLENQTTYIKT